MAQSPCFLFPLADSLLLPFLVPFTYLETLFAVTGSVHLGLRLLVNWPPLSQPFPFPPHSKFPVPRLNMRLTTTTSRIRLLLSGTILDLVCHVFYESVMRCAVTDWNACQYEIVSNSRPVFDQQEVRGVCAFGRWNMYFLNLSHGRPQ